MTDQPQTSNTMPNLVTPPVAPVTPAQTTDTDDLAQATAFTQKPNPASVYDELDNLTLKPEEMALMGALTQTQADVAEESASILADMKAVMAEDAAAPTPTK